MSKHETTQDILRDIDKMFIFIHDLIDEPSLKLDDQYKKINYTYFKIFCCHLESFVILVMNNHFSSAILLMRTMLELFVKSFYFEFIEKDKGALVEDFLTGKKEFPSFFNMTKVLEEYNHNSCGSFGDSFKQFTKHGLASYEKFSLFSHGKGAILEAFYHNKKATYTTEQISDVLLTAKGLLEQLSLLLFFTQKKVNEGKKLLNAIKS